MSATRFTSPMGPFDQGRQSDGELDIADLDTMLFALPTLPQRRVWLLTWAAGHDEKARAAARAAFDINLNIEDGEATLARHYNAWERLHEYTRRSAQEQTSMRWHEQQMNAIEQQLGELRNEWMRQRTMSIRHQEAAQRLREEARL